MSTLQRSSSAPQTLSALVPSVPRRGDLPRSKSHLHVQKHETRPYLKPLVPVTPIHAARSSSSDQEDPFNLSGFFPRDEESWRWLRAEPERTIEEEEVAEGEEEGEEEYPRIFGERGEEKRAGEEEKGEGLLSLLWTQGTGMLSPYRVSEGEDYEALYESHCGRRRTASRDSVGGPEGDGFGVLFFPGSS